MMQGLPTIALKPGQLAGSSVAGKGVGKSRGVEKKRQVEPKWVTDDDDASMSQETVALLTHQFEPKGRSDLTIVVGNAQFEVHTVILAKESSLFRSTLDSSEPSDPLDLTGETAPEASTDIRVIRLVFGAQASSITPRSRCGTS